MKNHRLSLVIALLFLSGFIAAAAPMGTAFTYQGRLDQAGSPVTGIFDLRFAIFDLETGGSQVGNTLTNAATPVTNGLFTVTLDFGESPFNIGLSRWLQVETRTNGAPSFTVLTPRQALTSAPYSLYAQNAGTAALAERVRAGSITSSSLATGAVTSGAIAAGAVNSVALAPGSVTAAAIAPGAVSSLGASDGWPTNAVVVNGNGLVGIGTNAPGAALDIAVGASIVSPQILFERWDESDGFTNLYGAGPVVSAGNLLVVAGKYEQGFTILDISNPQSPVLRSQFRDGEGAFGNVALHHEQAAGLAMKTNLLIVGAGNDNAVTLISLTNPATPVKLAELRDGVGGWNELGAPFAVAVSGNLVAIAAAFDNAVTLADISNPAAPVKLAELKDGQLGFTNLAYPQTVALSGNLLAIGAYNDNAVTLVNVANPSSPGKLAELRDEVNGFTGLGAVTAVALSGNLLAVASLDGNGALTLVNVANPSNPVKLAELRNGQGVSFLGQIYSVAFCGNWLAASSRDESAVTLFDVADPANPRVAAVLRDGVAGFNALFYIGSVSFAGTNLAITALEDRAVTLVSLPSAAVAGLVSQQRVGIGTAQPAAPLHVVGNVVVQDATLFDINASRVEFGNSTATGDQSIAMGPRAVASDASAMAFGTEAAASGYGAISIGYRSTASGEHATAFGVDTIASGLYSTALGYRTTADGHASLAAGRLAHANHGGTFVWSDTAAWDDFGSTADNQFLIRAGGGVGINKNNPATALDVNGTITGTGLSLAGDMRLNDHELFLRGDSNHGLGWYGSTKPFGSTMPDGPVLYGYSGGALGTFRSGSATNVALSWDNNRTVSVNGAFNANGALNVAGTLSLGGTQYLNDHDIQFRNDTFHGLGWYGAGKLYAGNDLNGPALYGGSGGALGTRSGTTDTGVLFWKSSGNVGIGTNNPTQKLVVVGNIYATGTITPSSDRNLKTDFAHLDAASVLEQVAQLPIQQWRFQAEPAGVKHVGPMAQDFKAAFGLGETDKAIATVDADGVALAAIQGLNQKVESGRQESELRSQNSEAKIQEAGLRIQKLEAENADLKARLSKLEQLILKTPDR